MNVNFSNLVFRSNVDICTEKLNSPVSILIDCNQFIFFGISCGNRENDELRPLLASKQEQLAQALSNLRQHHEVIRESRSFVTHHDLISIVSVLAAEKNSVHYLSCGYQAGKYVTFYISSC